MSQSTHTSRRTRWLAGQAGVHIPYLNLLPASETVRYASAAVAMLVSVVSAAAGWALVGSWSAASLSLLPRIVVAGGAGLAAGIVVWSIDRELIAGEGHLGVRGVIGAVNALFVGEIVLLALFSPFVDEQLQQRRTEQYDQAVADAEAGYLTAISNIGDAESEARTPVPESLVADRAAAAEALTAVRDLEGQLAELNVLRTAEVTGRVVLDEDGQPLTSGRSGDSGLATDSVDRQISDAEQALDRAVAQLETAESRLASSEAAHTAEVERAGGQAGRFNDDRLAAQTSRDDAITEAEQVRSAPVDLLGRIDVFHHAVWSDAVLTIAVLAVHLAVLAAELSVVLWAINDRRRSIRLYPHLVAHINDATSDALPQIAQAVVDQSLLGASRTPSSQVVSTVTAPPSSLAEEPGSLSIDLRGGVYPVEAARHAVHDTPALDATPSMGPAALGSARNTATPPCIDDILRPHRIEVTLLGPSPSVTGCDEPLRPKHLAVLAYLALHRSADIESLRRTFWPGSPSASSSNNTISAIRKKLGDDSKGEPLLAGQRQGQLTLSAEVGSDWARLCRLTSELPADSPPAEQIPLLVAALNLVAGPPGAAGSLDNWDWLRAEATGSGLVATGVRRVGDRLVVLARHLQRPDLVDWATAQANLVGDYDPPDENTVSHAPPLRVVAGGANDS